jgi:hypothetical protein
MRHKLLVVTLLLSGLSIAGEVQAQQQVPSYQPTKPTLSPYLYLTRPDFGPFPNYQTYVEPYKNQQQFNLNQQTQITQLQQGQQQQQQQSQQSQFAPAQVAPTGVSATTGNLSHYYPSLNLAGARGASRGRAPAHR